MFEGNMDYERLREDLLKFYKTTMGTLFPGQSMFMIKQIEIASDIELINIANDSGISVEDYRIKGKSL